jgi:hypothetical protein
MKKLLLIICIISFSSIGHLFAQKLYIDPSQSILFPTSLDSGSTISLRFHVVADTFTAGEYINMNYRVINSQSQSPAIFIGNYAPLTAGDSAIITDSYFRIESYSGFSSGEDIVVIWPTGSGGIAYTSDSITDTLHINTLYTGVPSLLKTPDSFKITVYPDPSGNLLYLTYDESAVQLEQVRIYDLLGRVAVTKTSSFNTISISTLPDGLYFLEAITTDNNRFVSQFVKPR